jgi:hypothetical protein
MARVLRFRNFGVYVFDERGSPHHLPHGHIKGRGGHRYASVYLLSLELFNIVEDVGEELMEELEARQDALLAAWEELNSD